MPAPLRNLRYPPKWWEISEQNSELIPVLEKVHSGLRCIQVRTQQEET